MAEDQTVNTDLPPGMPSTLPTIQGQVPVISNQDPTDRSLMEPQDASNALASGNYRLPNPAEHQEISDKVLYGPHPFKALGLGALQGASLGAIPFAMRQTGMMSEAEQTGLRKAHPGLFELGNIGAGVAAALPVAELPEALGVGRYLLNPMQGVMEAGAGVKAAVSPISEAVGSLASNLGAPSLAQSIVKGAISSGLGAAAEGALISGTNAVSELDMGPPTTAAEKLATVIGSASSGAFYGGILGAGFGGLGGAIPEAVDSAKAASLDFRRAAQGLPGVEPVETGPLGEAVVKAVSATTGRPEAEIQNLWANRNRSLVTPAQVDNTAEIAATGFQNLHDEAEGMLKKVNKEIRPMETKELLSDAETDLRRGHAAIAYQDLAQGISDAHVQKDIYPESLEQYLSKVQKEFESESGIKKGIDTDKITDATENLKSKLTPEAAGLTRIGKGKAAGELMDNMVSNIEKSQATTWAQKEFKKAWSTADNAMDTIQKNKTIYPAGMAEHIDNIRKETLGRVSPDPKVHEVFDAINQFKRGLDEKINFDKRDPNINNINSLMKGIRGTLKSQLEDEGVWGKNAARQQALNSALSDYYKVFPTKKAGTIRSMFFKNSFNEGEPSKLVSPQKFKQLINQAGTPAAKEKIEGLLAAHGAIDNLIEEVQKTIDNVPDAGASTKDLSKALAQSRGFSKEALAQGKYTNDLANLATGGGNPFVLHAGSALLSGVHPGAAALLEGYNALRNPSSLFSNVAKMERMVGKVTYTVQKAAKNFFKSDTADIIAGKLGSEVNHDPADMVKEMHTVLEESQNPREFVAQFQKNTGDMATSAPKVTAALGQVKANAISFLASQVPNVAREGILSQPLPFAKSDIHKFTQAFKAVNNPVGILKDVHKGSLSTLQMSAITQVFPELYNEMRSNLGTELIKGLNGSQAQKSAILNMPYGRKQALSLFLGETLDQSMLPQFVQASQAATQNPGAQQAQNDYEGRVKTSQEGLSNVHLAGLSKTPMQRSQTRAEED